MKFLKFFQYAYLFFAIIFIYDAISKWKNHGVKSALISLGLAILAIFMFFFRKKFRQKMKQ